MSKSKSEQRYDSINKTMWLFRAYDDPDTLVPDAEVNAWGVQLRAKKTESGQVLERVCYVFEHEGTAKYNKDMLAFARIETYTGALSRPTPFGGAPPTFETAEDFGIS